MTTEIDQTGWLPRERFELLFNILTDNGYSCIGPRVRDGAIVYETINSAADLPQGITEDQHPGDYRLSKDNGARNFSWATQRVSREAGEAYFANSYEILSERDDKLILGIEVIHQIFFHLEHHDLIYLFLAPP